MRTQQPHASLRDVPADLPDCDGTGACFPGGGLCCPDDPLDLVLQLFPAHTATDRAPPPSSLAALGIGGAGGGGEPPRREQDPQPLAESAYGGGGGGGGRDSWGLSSFLLEGLCGLEEIDVDMFFADDALDGGGEATEGNLLSDPTGAKPKSPAHMTAAAGGPVHTRGSLGGAVPNDDASPPLPAPMPAVALEAYDACRAFDGAVSNNASPPVPAACGGAPKPVFVTNNGTRPLLALMPAAAPAPTPPLLALMPAAAPAPMPPAAPAPMPAAGLHACGALPGVVSNSAPAPPALMAPMPARAALHPNAALAGVYSSNNAPAHAPPPSATPSSSPPSRASSGSGATSETEFLQPHASWVVPRKQRSPPVFNRRKRPWLLDFPLHALPPVVAPPPANPGRDDDDAKNRNALVPVALAPPPGNTGGGGVVRRRRPAPRQRNRQAQRVCSHCHSPETPQWRAGPDGPGTLCNACGIRYAANRLLPEYRPSTAPSFRSGQHSNRHRKVMKLREQIKAKEEKPSSEQAMEDGTDEKDDGFMQSWVYVRTYQQQQASCDTPLDQFNCS